MGITFSAKTIVNNLTIGSQPGFFLQTFPNALVAFSLRRLNYDYTGPLITVRRSSDNTQKDIYTLNDSSLQSFVGSSSGFVSKWYDQSGNDNHLTQTTTANQPRIVNSGIIDKSGNKPSLFFSTGATANVLNLTTRVSTIGSVFSVVKPLFTAGQLNCYILGDTFYFDYHGNTDQWLSSSNAATYVINGNNYINNVLTNFTTTNKTTNLVLLSMIHTASSGRFNSLSTDRNLGGRQWKGYYTELVLYSSNQTTNRVNIENNINNYYNIY